MHILVIRFFFFFLIVSMFSIRQRNQGLGDEIWRGEKQDLFKDMWNLDKGNDKM